MPTSISIGPPFAMVQDIVYALPAVKCTLYTSTAATIVASDAVGMSATTAVTLTTGQATVAGGFIKCTSGAITVLLKRD